MKTVASFSTPAEAHLALTKLESAGIAASIRDENFVAFNWLGSNAIGGVKIDVPDDDYQSALDILELAPPEEGLIQCPHCGSRDTRVKPLNAFGAFCMLLRLPIPMTTATVYCRSCKKEHDVPIAGK